MSVLNSLYTGLYNKLSAGTALTALIGTAIYNKQAPDGAALPYVVYSLAGGGPINYCPLRVESDLVFVRAYGSTDASARNIDVQIDVLLHGQTLTMTGGYINIQTWRETDLDLIENLPNNQKIYMAGGMYRIKNSM